MKNILLTLILFAFIGICSQEYPRIGSQSTDINQLKVGDSLISALGYFKLTLQENKCQLTIYQFDQQKNDYVETDSYTNNQVGNCKSIKIIKQIIKADTGNQLLKLSSPNFQKTWLTIDDKGTVRFIGVKKRSSQTTLPESQQIILKAISDDKLKNKNIVSDSQMKLNALNTRFVNDNNWTFQVSNNNLDIYKQNNPALIQSFNLENINLDRAGIYDSNNRSKPLAYFSSALTLPRCDLTKSNCAFRSPYTIQFNKQWPVAKIYDQDKYLIAQYAYGQSNNYQTSHVCPPGIFLYKGSCITKCPLPYYQKVSGGFGQCVLNCEQGSIIDSSNRRCACSSKDLNANQEDTQRIKKCQRQWNAYFYGCDCSPLNQTYDRINSLSCQKTCPAGTFTDGGICLKCSQNCQSCARDQDYSKYLKCTSCVNGYRLEKGNCVKNPQTCESNCETCNGATCTKCSEFYSLFNGDCIMSCGQGYKENSTPQTGSVCIEDNPNNLNGGNTCYVGCNKCDSKNCLSCAEGYVLFVSPLSSTCKFKSAQFTCSGQFVYDKVRQICYIDNVEQYEMGKCKPKITGCQTCDYNSDSTCILCERGYYLHQNKCVTICPSGFINDTNICIQRISDCQIQGSNLYQQQGSVNFDLIKNSANYKKQIANGQEPANNLQGYAIYNKQFILQQNTNNQTFKTVSRSTAKTCLKCRKGYGLTDDQTQCKPCPSSCKDQYCYYARDNSCYKPTIKCTFKGVNNQCMQSCPFEHYPQIAKNSKNQTQLRCLPQSSASVSDYVKMDSSFYQQQDGSKIYFLVLDKQVQPVINATNQLSSRLLLGDDNDRRLLLTDSEKVALQKGQYYAFRNTKDPFIKKSFQDIRDQISTAFGFTLANSVYGAEQYQTHNQWMKQWLAHIGYILSWVILIVHCLYIGNTILYKADNLIIFCQSIYFFTFVKLLVGNSLCQYYYGWFWMHMGFWPNYFKSTVPSQYQQRQAPLSFKLATLDGNLIRNAGFAISLYLTFIVLWVVICVLVYLINKIFKKHDLWYLRIAKNTLLAGTELLSMVIFYFSVTQLLYGSEYPSSASGFHTTNKVFAIIFICLIVIYMIVRFFFNHIGGLYMFKRLSIALILVDAYQVKGFVALLVGFQVLFLIIRYFVERPRLLKDKLYMLFQALAFIIAYFLLFLVIVPGVNVLIITIIIFVLLMFLIADLMDLYFQSQNQFFDGDFLADKHDNPTQEQLPDSQRKMNV